MQSDNDTFLPRTLAVTAIFAVLIACSLIVVKAHYTPQIFQLRFNPFAILSAIALLGTVVMLTKIALARNHSDESVWFMLIMVGLFVFAGGELLQRLSATPVGAIFWAELSGYGVLLIPIGVFMFAVSYTRPPDTRPGIIVPIMLAVSAVVSLFYAEGNLIYNNAPSALHSYPWGYNNDVGPAFVASMVWIFLPSIIGIGLLLRFHHHSHDQLLRRQSLTYAIAIAIPVFGGIITDGLLPALQADVIPPLASVLQLGMIVTIFYGISQYRLFQINPAALADSVLKTMNEAVVVTRPDFMIEFINQEAERLLGYSRNEITDQYIHRLFSPDSWPKVHDYLDGKARPSDGFDDIAIIDKHDRKIPVRVFVSNLLEGADSQAIIFVISDMSDITESYNKLESDSARIRSLLEEARRLERQLATEKAGVEQTVTIRTRELLEAQEQLKESDTLKTEFIMLGSHNLRTPITVMANSVELLKSAQNEDERANYFALLDHGVGQLRDFVEDMVTISSLGSGGGFIKQPCTITDLLTPIVTDFNALAKAKTELSCEATVADESLFVNASAARLQGAIRNLVTNAFKFTSSGSVTLHGHKQDSQYVIIVQDSGIGIAAAELPKMFTMFHRGTDTLKYEYEGKGIGLYLVKLIVEQHGGTVSVESQEGQGSTFTVRLPLVAAPVAAAK